MGEEGNQGRRQPISDKSKHLPPMNTKTTKPTSTNQKDGGCPPTDFGGPIGCLCTMILLPLLVIVLAHWAKVGYLDLNMNSIRNETSLMLFGDNGDNFMLLKCLVGLL